MAVTDWSTTPASNTSLAAFNLSEGATLVGDFNGIVRQLMADIRAFSDTVPSTSALMPKAGGTFSGAQPIYTGRGAYLHSNDPAHTSGRVFDIPYGGTLPTGMVAGDIVFELEA